MHAIGKIIIITLVFLSVSCSGNNQLASASFSVDGMDIRGGIL